ncbi:MAG: SCP2 sterol-binding domain-containing protein [Gammaproteobacteria bacterium]|nr:SCP2 sterol-binding domain-containing protein [Gammaproteobacteria bacterium]
MNIFSQTKRIAGFAARKIPFPIQKQFFERGAQQIFKEPLQQGELDFLEQHKIKISILDMGISWVAGLQSGRLTLYPVDSHADAHISGNADEFVLLVTGQEDPDTLFFQRRLNIEGSTEISLSVKNVMDSIGPLVLPVPLQKLLLRLVLISKNYSAAATHSRPL